MLAWDHLRFALALARHGTVAGAGAALGMEPAAAAERFRAMEVSAGATLFYRSRTRLEPTDAGWRLLRAAERLGEEMSRVKRVLPSPPTERVRVRVSIEGELARLWLRASGEMLLAVLAESELELTHSSDAELTVGWTRPARATARRLGVMGMGLYATAGYLGDRSRPRTAEALRGHRWVLAAGTEEETAAERWGSRHARRGTVALRAEDAGLRAAAITAGMGVGVLLQGSEDADPELVRLFPIPELRPRTVWLGHPRDTRRAPHHRRAAKAIDDTLGALIRRWQKRG